MKYIQLFLDQYTKLQASELSTLIKENTLRVVTEYSLFELVLKWINFDRPNREQYTAMLMEGVRLPLLTGEQLVDMVTSFAMNHNSLSIEHQIF